MVNLHLPILQLLLSKMTYEYNTEGDFEIPRTRSVQKTDMQGYQVKKCTDSVQKVSVRHVRVLELLGEGAL